MGAGVKQLLGDLGRAIEAGVQEWRAARKARAQQLKGEVDTAVDEIDAAAARMEGGDRATVPAPPASVRPLPPK